MESTRTPSTLAKVSLGTVTIMFVADSWIFSAHAVIGIMSDNKTSLPLLVPAFLFLCSAVVFGPVSVELVVDADDSDMRYFSIAYKRRKE